jgi:hypothetical protein
MLFSVRRWGVSYKTEHPAGRSCAGELASGRQFLFASISQFLFAIRLGGGAGGWKRGRAAFIRGSESAK